MTLEISVFRYYLLHAAVYICAVLVRHDGNPCFQKTGIAFSSTEISASHGIQFVNVLDAFEQTRDSNKLFYVVDAYLNGEGQVLISGPLVSRLTQGTIPILSTCGKHRQQ